MAEQSETQEVILIGDDEGNRYLIRMETLEQGKVVGDQVDEINELVGADVEGFGRRKKKDFSFAIAPRQYSVLETFSVELAPTASSSLIGDAMRAM